MDTWDDLACFLAAWREGSAKRAASALGVSVSTVGRRLDRLEQALGKPLFVRTAEGLEPASAAHALLPHALAAEYAVHAGVNAVAAVDEAPVGRVTIALPADMVQLVLLPVMAEFLEAFPGIELVFDQGSGLADLMRREADIAVRIIRPTEGEELVVTRLRDVELSVFARPSYLATLADPSDPTAHRWITWPESLAHVPEATWLARTVPDARIALRANNPTTARLAAAAVWDAFADRLRHKPEQDDVALLTSDLMRAYGALSATQDGSP